MTNDYVVLGDPQTCAHLRQALSRNGMKPVDEGELEVQDEFEVRRWFGCNTPHGTFICIGLLGQTSVANFLFTTAGVLNVVRAAVGNSKRLILVSHFPTTEFFLMNRLVDLYYFEKQLDFYSVSRNSDEKVEAFADRCVLCMRDVSATEAHQKSTNGPHQGGEVRDQVLSQSQGNEQHGAQAKPVLEVPVQAAQGAASGDLRPELASADSQKAAGALHPDPGAV